MKQLFAIIFSVFFLLASANVFAQNDQIETAYAKLFAVNAEEKEIEGMFAASFLKIVPVKEIVRILKVYSSTLGDYKAIDQSKSPFVLNFAKGKASSTIGFDSDGKINTLWFGAPELVEDSIEKVLELFKACEGKVSVCLMKNNSELLIDINSTQPMAVGSSFKLYILKAIEQQVKAGKRSWTDLIKIDDALKSFPSGILHDWPAGTSLTLESMAGLMISLSDNTATDHLFNLIGREEMGKIFPENNNPAFSTLDMFKLKIFYPEEGKKFIKADMQGKLEILERLAPIKTDEIASAAKIMNWPKPIMIDSLEWFISARDLCATIYDLRESSLIKINPAHGMVDKKDWQTAGFKGGSEPGVLNYTWVLQRKDDPDWYCLSCTLNNSENADKNSDFDMAVARLVKLILQKKVPVH